MSTDYSIQVGENDICSNIETDMLYCEQHTRLFIKKTQDYLRRGEKGPGCKMNFRIVSLKHTLDAWSLY